jgi:hypothetical protein
LARLKGDTALESTAPVPTQVMTRGDW